MKKILKLVGIFMFFIAMLAFIGYNWYTESVNYTVTLSSREIVEVKEGETFLSLLPYFEEKGLIKNQEAIKLFLRLNEINPKVKVGKFILDGEINIKRIIEILQGNILKASVTVTLREGLWNNQIAEILEQKFNENPEEKLFSKERFLELSENPDNFTFNEDNQKFLNQYKPAGLSLIGFLYPDTYLFDIDSTSEQVINILLDNFRKRINGKKLDLEKIATHNNFNGFYDALILASIIEKESAGADDRNLISSVFHNRIEDNWFLQSDATLGFVLRNNNPRLTLEDQKIDSPYNTYMYRGLPPTPISNPGIASIEAAINPTKSNYYFFRHDKYGKIYFTETYAEHQISIINNP